MLPTRSCPRQFAATGGAEVAAETETTDGTPGDGSDVAGVPATGAASDVGAAGEDAPGAGGPEALDSSAGGAAGEGDGGGDEGGDDPPEDGALPAGGGAGENGPGAPTSGGAPPGGGGPESGSRRPKSAAARRILKKYMTTIASANAMSSPIVKR